MTTAHRPTFDPARGKEAQRGPAYHQRLLPAHTVLKHRQEGQGTTSETGARDLRAELLQAEAAYFAKKSGTTPSIAADAETTSQSATAKRSLESAPADEADEDPEAKRRRLILEEAAELDADSDNSEEDSDDDDDSDEDEDEDDEEQLMRELEKIKRERAAQKAAEDAQTAARDQEQKEVDIARGNPLLNQRDFSVKRRWDEDVVFKNQARGADDEKKKGEFVNDLLRSDFHRRFMGRFVR